MQAEVLFTECVRIPPPLRIFIALLVLFALPYTQLWSKNLQKNLALRLLLGPASRVFLVEFLLRPARLTVGHFIIACAVIAVVVIAITVLNYLIFHRTMLRNVNSLSHRRKIEISIPRNAVQQLGANLTMTLACQQLAFPRLSITRVFAFGVLSIVLERIYSQWILFENHRGRRLFISNKSSSLSASGSADTSHWYIQVERDTFDIFKDDGVVTARAVGNKSGDAPHHKERDIPLLWSDALYIPFAHYGVAGSYEIPADKTRELVKGVYQAMGGVYSSSYQSCQEFAIMSLCVLCDDPLYNMSDSKSLGPIALVLSVMFLFTSKSLPLVGSYIWKLLLEDLVV